MKRLDTKNDSATTVNLLVYGKTGTGKTTLGVTAPKPLILLSEQQGMLHVKQAAKRLGVPVPPTLCMETLEDYRNCLKALRGPRDQPFKVMAAPGEVALELDYHPETVVLDSVTDCMRIIVDEIRKQSPQQLGKDGLPVDSQRFWNVLGDRAQAVILGFRDAPCHTVFLALADDRESGEGNDKTRSVTPAMPMRRIPDMLAAAVNAVGYSYRAEKRDAEGKVRTAFGVMFSGPEHIMLKACAPLRELERPNLSAWVKAIREGASTDAADLPRSQESMQEAQAQASTTPTEPEAPVAEPNNEKTSSRRSAGKKASDA